MNKEYIKSADKALFWLKNTTDDELFEALSNCASTLMQKLEPLGEEFSKVLHENLWDLYEQ